MKWTARIALAFPFAVASVLSVLISIARPFHWRSEHLAGYCFLFASPWAWLLDNGWFGSSFHSKWLGVLVTYMILLWIPALLYSGCFWLLFRIGRATRERIYN